MKTAVCKTYRRMDRIPYPNAATTREVLQKLLDGALVAAWASLLWYCWDWCCDYFFLFSR